MTRLFLDRLTFLSLALTLLTGNLSAQQRATENRIDRSAAGQSQFIAETTTSHVPKNVAAILQTIPDEMVIGLVVLDDRGKVMFHHNSQRELPAASSVKSILLLELFYRFSEELDQQPRPDIAAIVQNRQHPAIAHFQERSQQEIADELSNVSIRQLGSILIDSKDPSGKTYSNIVYNGAANVAIALLGGPAAATQKMQRRDAAFRGVHLRRYMLARRNVTGDNTATPLALATLFQTTIGKNPSDLTADTVQGITEILHARDYPSGATLYAKGGALYSDPVTQVRSGHYSDQKRTMNYAIMASQKLASQTSGKEQHDALQRLTLEIYTQLQKSVKGETDRKRN
ncbi:MAG: hypothetical protein VYE64_06090 [Planctomycetota bacterium]|nr:hypothetical protein [Planctomycetota bacterium]